MLSNKILLLTLLTVTACSHKEVAPTDTTKRTSDIPARREFQVSNKVKACDNFFEYACGPALDAFQLREDRSRHDFAFDDSNERILDYKKKYFVALTTATPSSERETQLKNVYVACMDDKSRAEEERLLVGDLKTKLAALKTRDQVLKFFHDKINTGEESFLEFDGIANQKNPLKNDLYISFGLLTYPEKTYYDKPENVADLKALLTDFYTTIGIEKPAEAANMVVNFEIEYSKIYPTPTEWRELYTSTASQKKEDILKKYPNFEAADLLKRIPNTTLIRDFEPKSFAFINQKYADMSVEDLKSLYAYHALVSYLDDAYPEFFKKRFDFAFKHLGGPKVRPDRQERCTTLVMRKYSKELDSILWPRLFKDFPKQRVVAIAERIRKSILTSLKDNKWMSKSAKAEAMKKIKTMKLQLVAPASDTEWNYNPAGKYATNKPIENARTLNKLLQEKALKEFRETLSPLRWEWGPLVVNAYYAPEYNKFVLPVGILQPPFFDPALTDEENLGGLGTVIGHEMGHSIDDQGSKFDSHGVLKNWRSEADAKEFEKRTSVLIDQFNGAGHNGKLTLGENIGDNVGLTASLRAAAMSPKFDNEVRKKFFLQYAHLWCAVYRPSYQEQQLKTNPHALGWARTNEQIKQQTTFKEVYQCKDGDKMVLPADKIVHIW